VAKYITKFIEKTDPYSKTIVFARNINHAERLHRALVNANPEKIHENSNPGRMEKMSKISEKIIHL
jgi:type I site-specific restriction endonuclease